MPKNRRILLTVIPLVLVVALCIMTTVGTYMWALAQGVRVRSFISFENVSAKVEETQSFTTDGDLKLQVDSDRGAIEVTGTEGDQIIVEITKTGWGIDEETARREAENLVVTTSQVGNVVSIEYKSRPTVGVFSVEYGSDQVDLKIQVPFNTSVDLSTENSDLTLKGTTGEVSLKNNFGDTAVSAVEGSLRITNNNGLINLNEINAGNQSISVETNFGDIVANGLQAGEITLVGLNGEIEVTKASADEIILVETEFGSITSQELDAKTINLNVRNGDISLANAQIAGELKVDCDFGKIDLQDADAGNYDLHSSNCDIGVIAASGAITIDNNFGEINLSEIQDGILNILTENGNVVFSGNLLEGADHTISSRFGNVTLNVPDKSAFEIVFVTQFGEITSDFPITISGDLDGQSWQGAVNGGGNELNIETQNGDIHFQILDSIQP